MCVFFFLMRLDQFDGNIRSRPDSHLDRKTFDGVHVVLPALIR